MSEYPEDIWQMANGVLGATEGTDSIGESIEIIARAILSERERCAQVALSWATDVRNPQTARFTAGQISTAIRKPEKFESGANAAADSPALAKSSHEEAAQGAGND